MVITEQQEQAVWVLERMLPTKTECDYLNGWIKNGHIRKNLTANGEPQSIAGERKRRRRRVYACLQENAAGALSQATIQSHGLH